MKVGKQLLSAGAFTRLGFLGINMIVEGPIIDQKNVPNMRLLVI